MPLYEYQCTACDEVCEVLQKVRDKPLEKCPKCGGAMVKRVSSPAIQFKGNGWYITDYAKKSSAGRAAGPKDKAQDGGNAPAKPDPSAAPKDGKSAS
jgi:putative FmdB family regulatory protein